VNRAVSKASLWAALAALVLAGCGAPPPSGVERPGVAYVNERRRSEADVARASEAFHAKEHHGADIVFRTEENVRPGYYFFVKLDIDPPTDGRLILEVVRTENTPPERYDFALNLKPGLPFGEFVIGLTGKQSGAPNWRPVAWRVSVVDAKGHYLAARHSFLWGTALDLERR
jgi:hypothetical protein